MNAGFGIALVPQTGTVDDAPSIRIADAAAKREVGIAWLRDRERTPAERAFCTFVVDAQPVLSA